MLGVSLQRDTIQHFPRLLETLPFTTHGLLLIYEQNNNMLQFSLKRRHDSNNQSGRRRRRSFLWRRRMLHLPLQATILDLCLLQQKRFTLKIYWLSTIFFPQSSIISYKTFHHRKKNPPLKKVLQDEQIWHIIKKKRIFIVHWPII